MKGWYWHVHHEVIVEYCYDVEGRVEYIKRHKPEHEVETRLKWMTPVKGKLPGEVVAAGEAYNKVWEAYNKAREAYNKAGEAYNKAWKARDKTLEAYRKARETYRKAGETYRKAREACDKARKAYYRAGEARGKAREACDKTLEMYKDELEALHAQEHPGCPWNGKTLFPKEAER